MRHNAKLLFTALLLFGFVSAFDQPAGTKLWDFFAGQPIQSSPALGADGTVYFGADNGKLYAFDPKGNGKWEFVTGDALVASPAVAVDGTVIVGSVDGNLYAVGADGVEKWRFRADGKIVSSPAIGLDGAIHFGSMRNTLFAVNPDGTKRWEFTADDALVSSPAIGRDGTVYVASLSGTLYAVDLGGRRKWQFKAGDKVNSSPALGPDGTIYFGAFDGHVYAVKPNGSKKWTFATGAAVRGSAAVGPDGAIYIGSDDRRLYALAPDGFKVWTFTTGGWVRSTPAVSGDGSVYVGSYDNSFYAVTKDGNKRWEFATDSAISSSPALAPDGVVYFGGWNKRFYAVKGSGGLAPSSWAKFRGDARQTAFVEREFAVAQYVRPVVRPAFPVEDARPVAVVGQAAAAEELARAQAARELAMAAKKDSAARTKIAVVPPPVAPRQPDASAEAKRLAKARAEADAKAAREAQAARAAEKKAEADANRKMLADNARVLKDAELARKTQEQEDYRRALSASELARNARREASLREAATRKAAEDAERMTKARQAMERKAQETENTRKLAEAKAQAAADRKAAMELARQTRLQQDAERKAVEEAQRRAKSQQEAERKAKELETTRQAAEAKARTETERKAAMEFARQTRLQQDAERKAAEAKARADAQAEIAKSKQVLEESRRMLKSAEEARRAEEADAARRAAAAAELARLAKKESDQRIAAKQAADLAEAKRALAEAQAAEAVQRKAAEEIARLAAAERKAQAAAAARELAEAKARAELETKAAAEAERLRVKEQEISRKVMADSEKAARDEMERQAREAAREAAREQAAERRRIEAERQKWEPVSGGFFRRLFGGGSSEPKVKAETSAAPTVVAPAVSAPQATVSVPTPPPVAPVPVATPPIVSTPVAPPQPAVTTPAVMAPVASAPSVPLKIISDSAELVRPAAPAAPATSFFTPAQPTVDPLAEQIELIKQRAAAAQAQAQPPVVQPAVPQTYVPQVAPPVVETAVAQPKPEQPGFWSGVRSFFIRSKKDQQSQTAQQQQRPVAPWPPANIVVRDPRAVQTQAQVPSGLAPGGVLATNFPRVQYAPVTNQNNLFLSRAMGMPTNTPGMPQPPAQPREVREMRPGKTNTQGITDLQGTAPIEIIQGRVKAVLRVYTTGSGRVIPDLNGAELDVGQTYTIEAQPARGAVFLGWTGSIETNSPALRFVMRTGTILSANFQFGYNMEREAPEVAITSPADGARLNFPGFTLQGQARDNVAVAHVDVSVNGGPWEPAQGADNWVFQSGARPGPNYVRVRAVDQAGNESQPALRSFYYSVPSTLTVRVNGAGTVEPDWGGRLLDVGGAYELRATPAAGHIFTGWSGGVNGTSPLLQFTMQTNLVVEANFAPRVASLARGSFNGLVFPTNSLVPAKCGFFQVEVGADGSFTGFLRQGIASHPLAGRFDLNGLATATVTRAGQSPATVSLQLDTTSGERLMGRFDDDGTVIEMFAYRQVFDGRVSVTPLAGRYTFVMPSPTNVVNSPAGDAFGEIIVDGAGRVKFAGELPDGTPIRHEATLARNGLLPLHVPLAGGRGMLLGWITVSKDPNLDAFGEVIWHKPLTPQDRYYPGGFSTRRHLFGNLYIPTAVAASGGRDIAGMLSGGDLDKVILGDPGVPVLAGSPGHVTLARFNWVFRPDTGYVDGTFIHPATKQETAFHCALLQKRGWTSGYFLGQNHSGVVQLQLPQ